VAPDVVYDAPIPAVCVAPPACTHLSLTDCMGCNHELPILLALEIFRNLLNEQKPSEHGSSAVKGRLHLQQDCGQGALWVHEKSGMSSVRHTLGKTQPCTYCSPAVVMARGARLSA